MNLSIQAPLLLALVKVLHKRSLLLAVKLILESDDLAQAVALQVALEVSPRSRLEGVHRGTLTAERKLKLQVCAVGELSAK